MQSSLECGVRMLHPFNGVLDTFESVPHHKRMYASDLNRFQSFFICRVSLQCQNWEEYCGPYNVLYSCCPLPFNPKLLEKSSHLLYFLLVAHVQLSYHGMISLIPWNKLGLEASIE